MFISDDHFMLKMIALCGMHIYSPIFVLCYRVISPLYELYFFSGLEVT